MNLNNRPRKQFQIHIEADRRDLSRPALILFTVFALILCASAAYPQKPPESASKTPSRPVNGTLRIRTDPAGAEVYINDKLQGATDSEGQLSKPISLKAGKHKLVLKYPEHKDSEKEISIRAGETLEITETLTPTYGFLLLEAANIKPDAVIELDETPVAKSSLTIDSNNLVRIKAAPGAHTVHIKQRGYLPLASNVDITAGTLTKLSVALNREPAALVVKSQPSARLYINGEAQGSIVPSTGMLKINALSPDQKHKVLVEMDGYEKYETSLSLESGKETVLEAELKPLPTSVDFSESFADLSQWDVPKEWRTENSLLHVSGSPAAGMPKEKRYKDCEVNFDLRLMKDFGDAWIVRAKDKRNYYLFYLTGSANRFPNQLRTYRCRDGVYDLNVPAISVQPLPVPLRTDEDYRVHIRAAGNLIEHWITPSKTGRESKIGHFKDQNAVFTFGNIGFAVVDGEEFKVGSFIIKPLEDQTPQK